MDNNQEVFETKPMTPEEAKEYIIGIEKQSKKLLEELHESTSELLKAIEIETSHLSDEVNSHNNNI